MVRSHLKNGPSQSQICCCGCEEALSLDVNAETASDSLTITGSPFEMEEARQEKTLNPTDRKLILGAATDKFMRAAGQ